MKKLTEKFKKKRIVAVILAIAVLASGAVVGGMLFANAAEGDPAGTYTVPAVSVTTGAGSTSNVQSLPSVPYGLHYKVDFTVNTNNASYDARPKQSYAELKVDGFDLKMSDMGNSVAASRSYTITLTYNAVPVGDPVTGVGLIPANAAFSLEVSYGVVTVSMNGTQILSKNIGAAGGYIATNTGAVSMTAFTDLRACAVSASTVTVYEANGTAPHTTHVAKVVELVFDPALNYYVAPAGTTIYVGDGIKFPAVRQNITYNGTAWILMYISLDDKYSGMDVRNPVCYITTEDGVVTFYTNYNQNGFAVFKCAQFMVEELPPDPNVPPTSVPLEKVTKAIPIVRVDTTQVDPANPNGSIIAAPATPQFKLLDPNIQINAGDWLQITAIKSPSDPFELYFTGVNTKDRTLGFGNIQVVSHSWTITKFGQNVTQNEAFKDIMYGGGYRMTLAEGVNKFVCDRLWMGQSQYDFGDPLNYASGVFNIIDNIVAGPPIYTDQTTTDAIKITPSGFVMPPQDQLSTMRYAPVGGSPGSCLQEAYNKAVRIYNMNNYPQIYTNETYFAFKEWFDTNAVRIGEIVFYSTDVNAMQALCDEMNAELAKLSMLPQYTSMVYSSSLQTVIITDPGYQAGSPSESVVYVTDEEGSTVLDDSGVPQTEPATKPEKPTNTGDVAPYGVLILAGISLVIMGVTVRRKKTVKD